ncbi:ABC transporter permease subunit [Nakamurella antarctica]|uniref:ABC transporter permease subunit n=1 Tax=Nakamurella antarctica TaxID=1902245 RepID=A0A3G8ZQK4_9ACTN|nr:ABC transporter permease subunit [Nakamurella antarctica]AZI56834.1 ABC transporter permease subunit [Nakamurella antarctica]
MTRTRNKLSGIVFGILGVLVLAAIWELYKWLGPTNGVAGILPKSDDRAMPHLWSMVTRAFESVNSTQGSEVLWLAVVKASLNSLGVAAAGWLFGSLIGFLLALLMQRFAVAERAVLPWLILSQTVPLIALAPVIVTLGGKIQIGAFEWEKWMSVAVVASFLAFFPVAVGALRGLSSPTVIHLELMRTYGIGWWKTLLKLRLPASVPYLLPGLALGAVSAIVGTVVGEVSVGYSGGIGRMIIAFAQSTSSDPNKPYAPIAGAVLMGLTAAGLVALIGLGLSRYRRQESST